MTEEFSLNLINVEKKNIKNDQTTTDHGLLQFFVIMMLNE